MIRSQNAKIKNKINIHFAFSERPDPHQLKFVQFFSTQPISNYFTLQRYIALLKPENLKTRGENPKFLLVPEPEKRYPNPTRTHH